MNTLIKNLELDVKMITKGVTIINFFKSNFKKIKNKINLFIFRLKKLIIIYKNKIKEKFIIISVYSVIYFLRIINNILYFLFWQK